jgi:hypothetical protein
VLGGGGEGAFSAENVLEAAVLNISLSFFEIGTI